MTFIYLTLEQALAIHQQTIEVSGGGLLQPLNPGQLESVLSNIQNDAWYPTLIDKLTHVFFAASRFHCFADGNKRVAISLTAAMLIHNGHVFDTGRFIRHMENISYHVAAGRIDKELLHDLIESVLSNSFDQDEGLKLRLFRAMSTTE